MLIAALGGCGSRSNLAGFDGVSADGAGGVSSGGGGSGGASSGGRLGGGGVSGSGGRLGTGGFVSTGGSAGSGGRGGTGGGGTGGSGGMGTGGSGAMGTGGAGGSGGAGTGGMGTGGMGGSGGAPPLTVVIDYFKSSYPTEAALFGSQVALSADGRTLAVGVPGDSSAASGIDGYPFDDGSPSSGAVFVYFREDDAWVEQAYIKASNPNIMDMFGTTVALSGSGDRLAVGAPGESSGATGIGGDQLDNEAFGAGAVYLFYRSGSTWTQAEYIKASNTDAADEFGYTVALSSAGTTLAVGAPSESSAATGVDGDQLSNAADYSGAAYVFADQGFGWYQQAYVKASNTGAGDAFGVAVDLAGSGSRLLVGAPYEDSATTGVNGAQDSNTAPNAGAAYVLERSGYTWAQTSYVKASNTGTQDRFGSAVAVSSVGTTMAIGAHGERSLASGVNGDQQSDLGSWVGAVYVLALGGMSWTQEAYVKASNPQSAYFGASLALSAEGDALLVGGSGESSASAGINGNQSDTSLLAAGAAYLLLRGSSGWEQLAYIKAHNPSYDVYFGYSVALDGDADTVVIGAPYEDGSSAGINGDPTNLNTSGAGAAYVYSFQ